MAFYKYIEGNRTKRGSDLAEHIIINFRLRSIMFAQCHRCMVPKIPAMQGQGLIWGWEMRRYLA